MGNLVAAWSKMENVQINGLYVVVWEFHVKPEAQHRFESVYGPDGDWARLFRRCRDYRGTQLLRDFEQPGRYLTLDYWTSREALRQFKQDNRADYDATDKRGEALTENEFLAGEFATSSSQSPQV